MPTVRWHLCACSVWLLRMVLIVSRGGFIMKLPRLLSFPLVSFHCYSWLACHGWKKTSFNVNLISKPLHLCSVVSSAQNDCHWSLIYLIRASVSQGLPAFCRSVSILQRSLEPNQDTKFWDDEHVGCLLLLHKTANDCGAHLNVPCLEEYGLKVKYSN